MFEIENNTALIVIIDQPTTTKKRLNLAETISWSVYKKKQEKISKNKTKNILLLIFLGSCKRKRKVKCVFHQIKTIRQHKVLFLWMKLNDYVIHDSVELLRYQTLISRSKTIRIILHIIPSLDLANKLERLSTNTFLMPLFLNFRQILIYASEIWVTGLKLSYTKTTLDFISKTYKFITVYFKSLHNLATLNFIKQINSHQSLKDQNNLTWKKIFYDKPIKKYIRMSGVSQ